MTRWTDAGLLVVALVFCVAVWAGALALLWMAMSR